MIGKVGTGKGFGGCIEYCLENKQTDKKDKTKNRAEILKYNQCFGNKSELIKQFNEVRKLNQKQSKPVLHITISFNEDEKLSPSKLCSIAEDCAAEFGFADNQYLVVEHSDTASHQHIHIIANRIDFDGKTSVNDSNSYRKIANFCRVTEMKYSLKTTLNPKKFLSKEERNSPRLDKRKESIKLKATNALYTSHSFNDFTSNLLNDKIQVIKSRGISFLDDKGVKLKGSEIGLPLKKIEVTLERNRTMKNSKTEFITLNKPKERTLGLSL